MPYRLLVEFEDIFVQGPYRHRDQTLSTRLGLAFYEDLYASGLSPKLNLRVQNQSRVVSVSNGIVGVGARRGDGTFGQVVHGQAPRLDQGYAIARGDVALVEIGAELKILAKSMVKQIGRVVNDLRDQVTQFRANSASSISVGFVGVNHAAIYESFEGSRTYPTTGRSGHPHPASEAPRVVPRLNTQARPAYDEFLIFDFIATNQAPYPFAWVSATQTSRLYGALLTRVCAEYDRRFP